MGEAPRHDRWLLVQLPMELRFARSLVSGLSRYAHLHEGRQIVTTPSAHVVLDRRDPIAGAVLQPLPDQPENVAFCRKVEALGVPRVMIGSLEDYPGEVVLRADNVAVGRMAAEHLLGLGLRRLAFYGGTGTLFGRDRRAGFEAAASEAGAEVLTIPVDHSSVSVASPIAPELFDWLQHCETPVGLLAQNDEAAVHLHTAARVADLRCPEDVAIVGVDDDEVRCTMTRPALTSIDTGFDRLGFLAGRLIDRMSRGQHLEPQVIALPPVDVIARGSTDHLGVADPMVAEALRLLREHAPDPQTDVMSIATAIGAARRSLERRFQQALGRSIHKELVRLRMDRARQRLVQTNEPIARVAPACGYTNLESFYRTFKRTFGQTPNTCRRQACEGELEGWLKAGDADA